MRTEDIRKCRKRYQLNGRHKNKQTKETKEKYDNPKIYEGNIKEKEFKYIVITMNVNGLYSLIEIQSIMLNICSLQKTQLK